MTERILARINRSRGGYPAHEKTTASTVVFQHFGIRCHSFAYSPDKPEPMNADCVIKGGRAY